MAKKLYIEGTKDRSNGTLRQGFHKLIKQLMAGNMPKIIMGNDKNRTITKFKQNKEGEPRLLIDLDAGEAQKDNQIKALSLQPNKDAVFFMIQEMEAWFISQPEVLDKYYNEKVSSKLPKTNPKEIANPAEVLVRATKTTNKGKYHKVKDGTALLELLDATQLKTDFAEFGEMIEKLK